MTEKAEMLRMLVESRIALDGAYRDNIMDLCDNPEIPDSAIEMLQKERDDVLTELTQRIDALRLEIAK